MATTEAGESAPSLPVTMPDAAGTAHDLQAALASGPAVLGIYKSSCQASKTMFPFLERLHQRYAANGLSVFGVSQDSANVTRSFARRLELTFPILIEGDDYPVSTAFDITATPTVYLIQPDGKVAYTTMGFLRDPVNELGAAVTEAIGQERTELFTDDDEAAGVPIFVPG